MVTRENITSKQRAALKSMASTMSPIAQIGKGGITDNLLKTLSDALEARELIKVKLLETAPISVREAADYAAEKTNSDVVQVIGTRFVLYRKRKKEPKIIV